MLSEALASVYCSVQHGRSLATETPEVEVRGKLLNSSCYEEVQTEGLLENDLYLLTQGQGSQDWENVLRQTPQCLCLSYLFVYINLM